jgi:hypothetical protein
VVLTNGTAVAVPALAISRSTGPRAATACLTPLSTAFASVTSAMT